MATLSVSSRILIVNPYGIGDVLFTTPLVRILKDYFPNAYLGYLCNERTRPILESSRWVDRVYIFEKDYYRRCWRDQKRKCFHEFFSLLRNIHKETFEVVFDYSLSRQFGFFLALLRIPIRVGYNYKNRGIFLNHRITLQERQNQHRIVAYTRLLDSLNLAVPTLPVPAMEFLIPDSVQEWTKEFLAFYGISDTDRFIVIHPGGGTSWGFNAVYKRWPAEFFAQLAQRISRYYGIKIILAGDKTDAETIHRIAGQQINGAVVDIAGELDLTQLAAVLRGAWFVVCNDGGPLHIAVSQGTPTVSFFGPVDENIYGPFPKEGHLVLTNPVECRPCYRNFRFPACPYEHRCLRNLSAEHAFEKIRERFQR